MAAKKLGDLNGYWALLLKVTLAIVPIIAAMAGWATKEVLANSRDVAVMKQNRFTSKDGLEVWKQIESLRVKCELGAPPQWVVDRLNRMETKLDSLMRKERRGEK